MLFPVFPLSYSYSHIHIVFLAVYHNFFLLGLFLTPGPTCIFNIPTFLFSFPILTHIPLFICPPLHISADLACQS